MTAFQKETLRIGGVDVVVLSAGSGAPLMVWRSFAGAGHLLLDESAAAVESVAKFLS